MTGGLDLWPADPAIPHGRLHRQPRGRGRAVRDPRRGRGHAPLAAVAPSDDVDRDVAGQGGLADPYRGNAAHRRLATARGATLVDRTPVTAIREVGGALRGRRRRGTTHGAGRVILAADAWTNELLAPFDRRLPLTVTKEQVTYFAAPDPAAFAPDRFPVWIWMDEPSFYGIPTYGEAGPEDRPGRRRPADDARDPHVRARRGDVRAACGGSSRRYLPGAAGPGVLRRRACTRSRRIATSCRPACPERAGRRRRAGRRARLQVRVRARPRPRRAASTGRRRPTASWARSGSIARSCSRRTRRRCVAGLTARAAGRSLHGADARVPPYGHSAGDRATGRNRRPGGRGRLEEASMRSVPARSDGPGPRSAAGLVARPAAAGRGPGGGPDRDTCSASARPRTSTR